MKLVKCEDRILIKSYLSGLWYFANIIFIKNYLNPSSRIKIIILKIFGAKIGKNVREENIEIV